MYLYFGPNSLASIWHFLINFDLSWPLCGVCLAVFWSLFSSVSLAYILTYFHWFWHLDFIFFGINWLPFFLFWIWIKIVWKPHDSVRLILMRYKTTFVCFFIASKYCSFLSTLCLSVVKEICTWIKIIS